MESESMKEESESLRVQFLVHRNSPPVGELKWNTELEAASRYLVTQVESWGSESEVIDRVN